MACRKRGHRSNWIRPEKRHRIYLRDRYICVYCNKSHSAHGLTLDHIKPRALGGTNAHTNLVTACRSCNSSRQAWPAWRLHIWCSRRGFIIADVRRRIRNALRRKLPDRREKKTWMR